MSTQHFLTQAKRYWQTYPNSKTWMQKLRLNAVKSLESNGIPNSKNEKYKYTNLDKKLSENFEVKAPSHTRELEFLPSFDCYHLSFVNGQLQSRDLPASVIITELSQLDAQKASDIFETTKELLNSDPMFQLNLALTHNGVMLEFTESLKKPVVIEHILSEEFKGSCKAEHNIFIAQEGIKADILEIFSSNKNSEAFNNQATTVITHKNAKLNHTTYNRQDETNVFISNLRAITYEHSTYSNVNLNLGSSLSRYNIHVAIKETGAHANVHGLYALKDSKHCDISSYINHIAPHTTSDQLYKGILTDRSRGIFTGLIKVDQEAQLTDAKQLNRNLILSKTAHANSRPQLEIFADDVKCSHGSTTGQLSEDELFYFESRGIRKDKAKQMLARAFSYEVLLKVDSHPIRNYLQKELSDNFGSISI